MNNFGFPTWIDKIVPAIRDQVLGNMPGVGLTRDRIFSSNYSAEDHLRFPSGDQFITIFLPNFPVDFPESVGGGLYNTAFDSTCITTAFLRLEGDIENRSDKFFEDAAFGAYQFVQKLCAALQTFSGPTDATSGMALLRRPMLLQGFTIQPKQGAKDTRWNVIPVTWQVSFVADLGTNIIGV